MLSKSELAIVLSKMKVFDEPELLKEQYATDSEVAAELLWSAYMNGDVKDRIVADFGCGTGILGIGCLLLEAKKVFFVDSDSKAIDVLKENLVFAGKKEDAEIVNRDVNEFNRKADVVVQNPPFGTKKRHADRAFLEKAMKTADIIYSFHKPESLDFINRLSKEKGFAVTHVFRYSLPIKKAFSFHKKRVRQIGVACCRLEKTR